MGRESPQPKSATRTTEPRWLDDDQLASWRTLATLTVRLPWALERQLQQDAELSFMEYHVLARLSEEPDRQLRMSVLAELTSSSLSRLSHLVKRLEARGYVYRAPDQTNGRFTVATLTDLGYTKLAATAPNHVNEVRRLVIDRLSADELRLLGDLADRLVEGIERADP
ncbi:MarR family winged helix-turn-helix transcriptional regulator [Micromonospora sp. NPDC093277]|uniref:MarR family winged helix-turn-helix transcriptional regulator n=1 Tax=Micromonospora sp. NPDC093277 TaxID=3364291 RepID=UPI00382CB017